MNFYESFNIGYVLTVEAGRQALATDAAVSIATPSRRSARASVSSEHASLVETRQELPPVSHEITTNAVRLFRRQASVIALFEEEHPVEAGNDAPVASAVVERQSPGFFNRRARTCSETSDALNVVFV